MYCHQPEGNIHKLKILLKFAKNNFKSALKNLQPLSLQGLLAYFKSALEAIPYQQESTLSPKLVKGQSLSLPTKLFISTNKVKIHQQTQAHLNTCLTHFLTQLQKSHLCKPNFFYNSTSRERHSPSRNDITSQR